MKKILLSILVLFSGILMLNAQEKPLHPAFVGTGTYLGLSKPLRDIPAMSADEFRKMEAKAKNKQLNEKLKYRNYPYASTALPKGPDASWQRFMGDNATSVNPLVNFEGQTSPYYPPDCNGVVGPAHFMQTINCIYSIYDKTGATVAGPTNMNQLFGTVPGSNNNDGDPIILYDEQADRWVATEFSISGNPNYVMIAVSTTNDPTGTWHQYSFVVSSMPDYPKFSVWRDGYYMGDNNSSGNDTYVFQRDQMLIGGTAQMVGFNNLYRPSSVDGFMCVPPIDNDGTFAPLNTPGLYIAFNDDAFGGGTDQLWIYELAVNWATPASSTFNRTQQLDVIPFDCNFGNNWNNITQPGTSQKVDAIPQVIMNVPQYRNFGTYQSIVCCHTVDVDATNHAGIRWYELRKTTGNWSIRQTGTYAPDIHNRWMGSIMLNSYNQIALGYSISSSTEYPGIRFCGQSSSAYAIGNGIMDIPEDTIQVGANSQTGYNRWGDYSQLSVDPTDNKTFWFTTEYIGSGGSRKTKVASFKYITNPTVTTIAATDITGQSATLTGTINPQGQPSSYYFQYSIDGLVYSDSTESVPAGSGSTSLDVTAPVSNLLCNQRYFFRTVASYGGGIIYGARKYFFTLNAPFMTVTPPVHNVSTATGTVKYYVSSNTTWNVTHLTPWCTVTPSGIASDTIFVNYEENTLATARADTIFVTADSIGSQYVLLLQEGVAPILIVSPPNQNVNTAPGTADFTVTSNISWAASSDATWCTATASGTGNGTIMATYQENTTVTARIATITVSGIGIGSQTVTVTQPGVAPTLAINPLVQNVTAPSGSTAFTVISNTDWTVNSDALWCNVTTAGSGNGNIVADYTGNGASDSRTANIQVTVTGLPVINLTVVQAKAAIGIEELQQDEFRIYPNPTQGSITLISGRSDKGELEVTVQDMNGNKVFNQRLNGKKQYQINLSSAPKGVYHIIVKSHEKMTVKKLVIIN